MAQSPVIIFPHLNIHLPAFPDGIKIFGFNIAFYGILIAIGMILAIILSVQRAKKTGQKHDNYYDLALICILAGIVGARLYYVLFNLDYFLKHPGDIINIRLGGLAIYGGIIFGFLAGFIVCKIKKISYLQALDTAVLGIVLAQAIGRWGNFVNKEAFGGFTDSFFAMQIRLSDASGVVNDELMNHLVNIDGVDYIQVHPTFLYESLWCVLLFVLIIIFRKHQQYNGEVLLWYLGGYGLERSIVEGFRTDSLMLGNTGIPVSQLLSVILVVVSFIILVVKRVQINKKNAMEV